MFTPVRSERNMSFFEQESIADAGHGDTTSMSDYLTQYFRCPEQYVRLASTGPPSGPIGYFRFGESVCYGCPPGTTPALTPVHPLCDALPDSRLNDGTVSLSFDPDEVVGNLTQEKYSHANDGGPVKLSSPANRIYYLIRPALPVAARKHLQRIRLKGWEKIPFPTWPVDRTVDTLLSDLLLLAMKACRTKRIPFIWFWPKGVASAAIMTHDVETPLGRDFSSTLMDIDDSFGIKSSFQVVPEERYEVPSYYLDSITHRGFEVAVQDLNHDGRLYLNREEFLKRAVRINEYGRQWGAEGFRAAILYRRQDWFDDLDFSYDMSVPNVAHLDPQRGGCCTVMPYFVGKMLELPVTTTQDYTLFHILKSYSLDLWKRQIDLIMERNGLVSFIIHPDYITTPRELETYKALLGYLAELRKSRNLWIATPREVSRWWRKRSQMRLVEFRGGWHIEGPGSEDAQIAYATEENGRIKFAVEQVEMLR